MADFLYSDDEDGPLELDVGCSDEVKGSNVGLLWAEVNVAGCKSLVFEYGGVKLKDDVC